MHIFYLKSVVDVNISHSVVVQDINISQCFEDSIYYYIIHREIRHNFNSLDKENIKSHFVFFFLHWLNFLVGN